MDKVNIGNILLTMLKENFSEILVDNFEDNIIEGGMDSLKIIKFIIKIEEQFDFEFEDVDLTVTNFISINAITSLVVRKLSTNDYK